jgi:heme peroxidase
MTATDDAPPGVGGFFSLFNLPPTIFRAEALQALAKVVMQPRRDGFGLIEAGYTYLGQLIAHDVSSLRPPARPSVSAGELEQLCTPGLDLDCVYGSSAKLAAVDSATGKLLLGRVLKRDGRPGAADDLPRTLSALPCIPDERNEENLLLAQLHVQFIKLHNYFVDQWRKRDPQASARTCFEEARRELTLHYQQVVLYDFLESVLDPDVWQHVVLHKRDSLWSPAPCEAPRMPIEFAAAAFRFGHSMVQSFYTLNREGFADVPRLFTLTGVHGLEGQPALPELFVVRWEHFFSSVGPADHLNLAAPIKPATHIVLPEGDSLALRNLTTGNKSMLPDAQAIVRHVLDAHSALAAAVNLTKPLDEADLPAGFQRKTPLWYYILAEASKQHAGNKLGKLGSLIVASVLRGLVTLSNPTIGDGAFKSDFIEATKWTPESPATPDGVVLSMGDLLKVVL